MDFSPSPRAAEFTKAVRSFIRDEIARQRGAPHPSIKSKNPDLSDPDWRRVEDMLDFALSDEQEQMRLSVKSFVEKEVIPLEDPFWLTLDAFFADDNYRQAAAPGVLTKAIIADRYQVDADAVRIYRLPALRVIKVSFPRPVVQGSFTDHDMHSGQQHLPLAKLLVTTGGTR
jgi:hypothetical protein